MCGEEEEEVWGWKRCVGKDRESAERWLEEEVCREEEEEVCEDGERECREVVGGRVVGRRRERWGEEEVRTVCGVPGGPLEDSALTVRVPHTYVVGKGSEKHNSVN